VNSVRTSQVVTFLDSSDSLALDRPSPWRPTTRADEVVRPVGADAFSAPKGLVEAHPWTPPPDVEADLLAALRGEGDRAPHRPGELSAPLWDTDAWYQPAHFDGYAVGIFVRESAVVGLALELAGYSVASSHRLDPTPRTAAQILREAFLAFYLHEQFHHRVECLAVHLQVVEHRARYVEYTERAYAPAVGGDDLLEESLANGYAYRQLARRAFSSGVPSDVRRVTTAFLKQSWPADRPGYRQAARFISPDSWDQGVGDLHSRVQEATNQATRRATWRHLGPDLTGTFLDRSSDVFVVADPAAPAVVPRSDEPATVCSSAELVGVLERAGYTAGKRGRSSHVKLKSPGRPTAVVPAGGVLPAAVVARNLELVGAGVEDLPTLLGRG
jgi:hypothetical protein